MFLRKKSKLKVDVSEHRLKASAFVGVTTSSSVLIKESTDKENSYSENLLDMRKLEPPTFPGDIRTFAKFKADFKTIVEPRFKDSTSQAYAMKTSCLKGEALNLVKNISEIKNIWERLHDKMNSI